MKLGRFVLTVVVIISFSLNILFYSVGRTRKLPLSNRTSDNWNSRNLRGNLTEQKFDTAAEFPVNHPNVCRGDVDLVVVVCSGLGNFKAREHVRKSWGLYSKQEIYKTRLVFLVGMGDKANLEQVLQENRVHGDIIVGNFIDTYRNLTLKSISVLKWMSSFCGNAKYGLKADDDVFVNIPNLISAMSSKWQTMEKFIIGSKQIGAKPIQDKNSKWYTPKEDFGEREYPPYVSGTAYAFTIPAAKALYRVTGRVKAFWLEDIYITGLCARAAGIPRYDHAGFTFQRRKPTGCAFRRHISGHYVTGEQMVKIYNELLQSDLKCD